MVNSQPNILSDFPGLEPRPYQLEAWKALELHRNDGHQRALLCLATGLGKTSVAAVDALRFHNGNARILFVAHIADICHQARASFKHLHPSLTTARLSSGELPKAQFVAATFQMLYVNLGSIPRDYFDYIIWDESHHIEAKTFKAVCEHFTPKFELGLTATPKRADERDITKYFGKAVYTKTLAEGIAEGWLAKVNYKIVFDDAVKKAMATLFDQSSLKAINSLLKVKPRNNIIASNIRNERHNIGLDRAKTIVFCGSIAHAIAMADLLGGVAYHSNLSVKTRERVLREFKEGNTNVLCVRDMFNEGIDVPNAQLIVFLRSTGSDTIFEQQLGRGLRKTAGKESVTILDFVGNIKRIRSIRQLKMDLSYITRNKIGRFTSTSRDVVRTREPRPEDDFFSDNISFEFEEEVVKLLDLYDQFDKKEVPDGYYPVRELSRSLGVTSTTLIAQIKRMKLPPVQMFRADNGYKKRFVTLKCKETLERRYSNRQTAPDAPSGYYSKAMIMDKLKIGRDRLETLTENLSEPIGIYRRNGSEVRLLSPEQFSEIEQAVGELITVPDGYLTLHKVGQLLRTNSKSLIKACATLGIPTNYYLFRGASTRAIGIDRSHLPELVDYYDIDDTTYKYTTHQVAGIIGLSRITVARNAKRMGLGKKKIGDRLYLSDSDIAILRKSMAKKVPLEKILKEYDRSKSIQRTADKLGISWQAVKKRLVRAGVL